MPFPWYYHLGANLIQHRQRNYRIAKSAFAAYSVKRTMPYLRGSIKKFKPLGAGPASTYRNTAAIRTLQRKVNQLKPETQRFGNSDLWIVSANSFVQNRYDISADLAGTADRDLRISGDSWRNKKLTIRVSNYDTTECDEQLRMLVVVPKKAGTTFTLAENSIPDKDQMRVLYDRTVSLNRTGDGRRELIANIPLRDMKTTFIGTTPEKNAIYVYLHCRNHTGAAAHNVTWELLFSDM